MIIPEYAWDAAKNQLLRESRGVAFEDILAEISCGNLLDILAHHDQKKYPGQKIFVVAHGDYAYLVPFVEGERYIFLKTIIPSRKATRHYLHR